MYIQLWQLNCITKTICFCYYFSTAYYFCTKTVRPPENQQQQKQQQQQNKQKQKAHTNENLNPIVCFQDLISSVEEDMHLYPLLSVEHNLLMNIHTSGKR